MKIVILGCGAVGSLYAARLAQDPANEILCIVRSQEHARLINTNGITIINPDGTTDTCVPARTVTGVTSVSSPADLVLVSVKAYATEAALREHQAAFGPHTIALTLQNGYGNHQKLLSCVSPERIVLGTTSNGVNINEKGDIVLAGTGKTVIGSLAAGSHDADAAAAIKQQLVNAGFETEQTSDPEDAVLRKLLINVGINAVCSLHNKENRFILENTDMRARAEKLVREAVSIINTACSRDYDSDAMWANVLAVAEKTSRNICSMLQDVRNGRPTEISTINGAISDMAHEAGLSAPYNESIVKDILSIKKG